MFKKNYRRNPTQWNDLERFVPERFVDSLIEFCRTHFHPLPFGLGRRMCPGMGFAVANIELMLANLLYHFDWDLSQRP